PGDHTHEHTVSRQLEAAESKFEAELREIAALRKQVELLTEIENGPDEIVTRHWGTATTAVIAKEPLRARLIQLRQQLDELDHVVRPHTALLDERNALSEQLLETSFLGRFGQAIEPAVRPLGWD